jgi:hypothetical protein
LFIDLSFLRKAFQVRMSPLRLGYQILAANRWTGLPPNMVSLHRMASIQFFVAGEQLSEFGADILIHYNNT